MGRACDVRIRGSGTVVDAESESGLKRVGVEGTSDDVRGWMAGAETRGAAVEGPKGANGVIVSSRRL